MGSRIANNRAFPNRDMTRAAGLYNTLLRGDDPALLIEVLSGYRLKERLPLVAAPDPEQPIEITRMNLEQVKELRPMFKGEYVMLLQNGKRLTMTRKLREVEQALRFS